MRKKSKSNCAEGLFSSADLLPAIIRNDHYLQPYADHVKRRIASFREAEQQLTGGKMALADCAVGHEYFGLHKRGAEWILREWAPNARSVSLIGPFTGWREMGNFALLAVGNEGVWELRLPEQALHHGDLYRLHLRWPGGEGDRIPAYARRVVQDTTTKIFNAQVW